MRGAVLLVIVATSVACASLLDITDVPTPIDDGGVNSGRDSSPDVSADSSMLDAATDADAQPPPCANLCQPATPGACVIACGQSASDLAIDSAGVVYWVNPGLAGTVRSSLASMPAVQSLTPSANITAGARIAVTGNTVFFSNGNALWSVQSQNSPIPMTNAAGVITSLAVAGNRLGYTFNSNVSACTAMAGPCTPSPIGTNLSANTLSIVGALNTDLYWFSPSVQLWRCTKASCGPSFVNNSVPVADLAWHEANKLLYVLGGNGSTAFNVQTWAGDGTYVGVLLSGLGAGKRIAVESDRVFVATDTDILRSIGGGTFSSVAQLKGAVSIAVNSQWLVWIDGDKIMRYPR